MRKTVSLVLLYLLYNCTTTNHFSNTSQNLSLIYLGHNYTNTKNKSFVNDRLAFINGKDTLYLNIKVPFNTEKAEVYRQGIYYDCTLSEGMVYKMILKKACISEIPKEFNSYYHTNAVVDDIKQCYKFREIEKDTPFIIKGRYGKYVDIDNILYEVTSLAPSGNCIFPH